MRPDIRVGLCVYKYNVLLVSNCNRTVNGQAVIGKVLKYQSSWQCTRLFSSCYMPADGRTAMLMNSLRDAKAPNISGLSEDLVDPFYAAVLPVRRP
jgi:hypothetical protein